MTSTLKDQVLNMLQNHVESRQRRNRYKAVWFIVNERHHKDTIDKQTFLEIGPEIISITRFINYFQKMYPELRGSDYDDKKRLVQETQISLGYTPGYHQDLKRGQFYEPKEINDEDYG